MSRKTATINLLIPALLSAAILSGCDGDTEDPQRDVYENKEACLKDWNEEALCEQMGDEAAEEYRRQNPGAVVYPYYMWGPHYYSGDRAVTYQGRTIAPIGRSSVSAPVSVRSGSSIASRPSVSSPRSVSFGGFGGRGSGGVGE